MTSILYAPVLGQSNAAMMSLLSHDRDSGIRHLQNGLQAQAGFDQVFTLQPYSDGNWKTIAVGGSTVDGNTHTNGGRIWWYPNENQPGSLLLEAVKTLKEQMASLKSQGTVTPILIWGQGESEASHIGGGSTEAIRAARAERYLEATRDIFDYIKANVSPDFKFFLMETGRYSTEGAFDAGQTQATIDRVNRGLAEIDKAQAKLAAEYDDIFMGVDYDDLTMRAEESTSNPDYKSTWDTDVWHYAQNSYETIGDRLANAISDALGGGGPLPPPDDNPANQTVGTDAGEILIAGRLDVTMTGLGGADKFRFTSTSLGGKHVVTDFDRAEGDMIDIKKVLIGFDRLEDAIADFCRATDAGDDMIISVDPDGTAGGVKFSELAILRDVESFDVQKMLAAKGLIA